MFLKNTVEWGDSLYRSANYPLNPKEMKHTLRVVAKPALHTVQTVSERYYPVRPITLAVNSQTFHSIVLGVDGG